MKRALVALVAGAVLFVATAAPAAATQHQRIEREMRTDCQFQFVDHTAWTNREERMTGRCLVQRWSVPGGFSKLDAVVDCESSWYRFASNDGNYLGLTQQAASAWPSRVRSYEPAHWDLKPGWANSRSNLTVAVRMVHSDGDWHQWGCGYA